MGLANRISLCHKYYMYAGAKHENASRCVKSRMKKVNWNRYSKVKVFQNSQMFGNSVGDSFFACLLLWRARCAWCRPTHVSGHEPPQKCPCFASLAIRIALTCVQTYIYKHIHVHTCVVTYIHIQMSLQIYGGIYIYMRMKSYCLSNMSRRPVCDGLWSMSATCSALHIHTN